MGGVLWPMKFGDSHLPFDRSIDEIAGAMVAATAFGASFPPAGLVQLPAIPPASDNGGAA